MKSHALSGELLAAKDEERRRLARELHDTTAQHIVAVLFEVNQVREEAFVLSSKAQFALTRSSDLLRQSLRELRTFSYLLHPPLLEECGVAASLQLFVQGFSERSGIQVETELPDALPRMPSQWETALFYVVQEGLVNAQRHGRCLRATVRIVSSGNKVTICVENERVPDSGVQTTLPGPTKVGVGLWAMRERLAFFGGEASLYFRSNRTVLRASLPFPSG